MKRNIYINKTTDARLAAFGGAGRAENLRRAVALAEVAGELAGMVEDLVDDLDDTYVASGVGETCPAIEVLEYGPLKDCLTKYKEAKNVN